jgi:hypothetical protein
MRKLGGAAGDEIIADYVKVLADTNVTGYPFAKTSTKTMPGSEEGPLGMRVDDEKLLDLNAYLNGLPAPAGATVDKAAARRGKEAFEVSCTACHNTDQSRTLPSMIVPMAKIFPGDRPVTLAQREPPLNPVMNTVDSIFDDKMAVVNASIRGLQRGIAMPMLLDLARKPVFLHDNSVPDLETLLNQRRGVTAPHPFFIADEPTRRDVIAFLKSLSAK